MSKPFEYCVLKYRTSYLLDERVNIGLLFRFRKIAVEDNNADNIKYHYVFIYPRSLRRLSDFFPGLLNLNEIKRYLRAFQTKSNQLNKIADFDNESLENVIRSSFLTNDANSFFFSEVKQGFYNNLAQIVEYYKNKYFKHFAKPTKRRKDGAFIRETFEKRLKENTTAKDVRLAYFKRSHTLENDVVKTEFEYLWQNGTANLIKTLGFDLTDKVYIQNKAFTWKSQIEYWNNLAEEKNIRFDFLISKPTHKNLFKAYDNAIGILEEIGTDKKIIEEEAIEDYVEKALDSVKPVKSEF